MLLKKLKIMSLFILFIILTGCSSDSNVIPVEPVEKKDERVDYLEYLESSAPDFICSDFLDNNYIFINKNLVFYNNYLYEVTIGENQLFSNEENCLKIGAYSIDRYVGERNNYFFVGNKIYQNYNQGELSYLYGDEFFEQKEDIIAKRNSVIKITEIFEKNEYGDYDKPFYYYALENDGNIYEYQIMYNGISGYYIKNRELSEYNVENYGKITSYSGYSAELDFVVSEIGLYTLEIIETEECMKYADIDCEKSLVSNALYNKYKDQIKYIDDEFIITVNNKFVYVNSFLNSYNDKYYLDID